MKKTYVKIIKWLANRCGYEVALVRAEDGVIDIDGSREILRYLDLIGFLGKEPPLKREIPEPRPEPEPIKPLSYEELQAIFNEIESKNDIEKTEE